MWQYWLTFYTKETSQVFKGNWLLNNDLRDMPFNVGCFPSGRVRRGVQTIWPRSCVLLLRQNSSRERCKSVWINICMLWKDWCYSAHVLMNCWGSYPLLPLLTVLAFGWCAEARKRSKIARVCVCVHACVGGELNLRKVCNGRSSWVKQYEPKG